MNLADELLELMVRHGLSESEASIRAVSFAAIIGPSLARQHRDKAIRDMIPKERTVIDAAEYFRVHRATVYRALGRKSQKS